MAKYSVHCPKLPWMIDFHSTADGAIPNSQLKAAFASNFTEHLSELNVASQVPKCRLTGIVCTIGPSSNDIKILEKMMEAGMTVARIKMAFYTHQQCRELIKNIRKANDNYSIKIGRIYPLAIALDIKGPEIRTGSLKDPELTEIELLQGNTTVLTTDIDYEEHVTEDMIYVDYQKINEVVVPGDHIYLDNGSVTLSALEIVGSVIRCLIENVGKLTSHSSVSIPGIPTDLPSISAKDTRDIKYGVDENVDIIFASGVKNSDVINEVRELLGDAGKSILVIAKIENGIGISNLEEIIDAADGILILRAKLGVEIPPEKLFLIQKSIIAKCNKAGKPVLCSAHMLDSMINVPKPSSSEISDVANAVLDGVDSILLSGETAIGEYPVETIKTLSTVCKEAEAAVYQKQVFQDLTENVLTPIEPIFSISISAVQTSLKCNAAAIIVLTTSGRSAKVISKYRPRCPIIAITRYGHVARKLHVFRALDPIYYITPPKGDWAKDVDNRIQLGITYAKVSEFVRAGDALVIVTGLRPGTGFTNAMRVVYASEFDALPPQKS